MRKLYTIAATIFAAVLIFTGSAGAQQTPAASTQTAPAATKAPPAKTGQTPAAGKAPAAKSQPDLPLTTPKDKASYAIGMNFGKALQKDSVEVDPDVVARGLRDALTGAKPLMTDDESKAVLSVVQTDLNKRRQDAMQAAAETNKKEGEAFLAANKAKEGVITLPSGLQYKILKAGTGPKPTASDSVVCNYRGTTIDGTEFDSSYKRGQPATFPVGQVIPGWTEALQLMPVGSKWQIFIPAGMAYGGRGAGPSIGPNATLIFEVELLSIQSKDKK